MNINEVGIEDDKDDLGVGHEKVAANRNIK